jgi:ADP-heptose:LPS heptosyltransferase
MNAIVIAPFSNSEIRDWPLEHFKALIGILLEQRDSLGVIKVVGTKAQRLRGNEIVRAYDPEQVINACGRHSWPELVDEIRAAACVIGNNSGVAHLSGYHGTPTVCVFGGSHQRLEWRPLGFNVSVVTRSIGCSPCQLDHGRRSPYNKACLRFIEPRIVADTVLKTMERVKVSEDAGEWRAAPRPRREFADMPGKDVR